MKHRPNPRPERPFGGPNPADRASDWPWTTPVSDIRDRAPPRHTQTQHKARDMLVVSGPTSPSELAERGPSLIEYDLRSVRIIDRHQPQISRIRQ